MGVLLEDQLDHSVDHGNIGLGETVDIRTRMGKPVAIGEVSASTPFGLSLRQGGYYSRDMYIFIPVEEEVPQSEAVNMVCNSPDDRVMSKMRSIGQFAPVYEMDKLPDDDDRDDVSGKGEKDDSDSKDDDDDDDDDNKENKKKKKSDDKIADSDASINVDDLPDDIKNAITSTSQMDDEALNRILSDIGDSAVKSLKRSKVDETELYEVAAKIQKAVRNILITSSSGNVKKK